MASKRLLQLAEQIRDHVSMMMIRGEISDPRIKQITIHSVTVTPDMRIAKVHYVSGATEGKEDPSVAKGLRQASGYIRKSLAQVLQIRFTPEIRFYFDDAYAHGMKMNRILAGINQDEAKISETNAVAEDEK